MYHKNECEIEVQLSFKKFLDISKQALDLFSMASVFYRVISKPTKPKPAYIKGVTDKGFNVAFYVESSEGTQATPTKRFMLPIDSPDKEIVSLTKERPKTWKVDEGISGYS